MKVAFLGLGRVFQHYLAIWDSVINDLPFHVDVTCVCDIDISKFCIQHSSFVSAVRFNSVDSLVTDGDFDLCFVLTPSGLHFHHSQHILNSGRHVLTEKPAALNSYEISKLAAFAEAQSLHYGCIFQNRLNPAISFAHSLLSSNAIGKIRLVDISLLWSRKPEYYQDEWHGTWSLDGGVICQQAIHHIDASQYLLGNISDVCSFASNLFHDMEAEDTHLALLKYTDGTVGTFKATTSLGPVDHEASLSVYGSNGTIQISGVGLNQLRRVLVGQCEYTHDELQSHSQQIPNGYGLSHIPFLKNTMINISSNHLRPLVPNSDSFSVVSVIQSLYRSSLTDPAVLSDQKWVKVDPCYNFELLGSPANGNSK